MNHFWTAALLSTVFTPLFQVAANAATFRFDTDPFAGSSVLTTPGRQVVGNELFIPNFSIAEDKFSFDSSAFGVANLFFFNGLAADLPSSGLNAIVLQDSDNDNNPTTPFNAVVSADVIAAQIETPSAGFFVYFNSVLNVNRLVYSPDLSDNTADLKILARFTEPIGQAAIDALPQFTADNFESTAAVPEPTTMLGLLASGVIGTVLKKRKAHLKSVNASSTT